MQAAAYKEKALINALVSLANTKKAEVITLERLLNEAGITRSGGVSIYHMVETRALVLYALDIGRCDALLRQTLFYFIADYPVFRWSELRYHIRSAPERKIEAILHELKYKSRMIKLNGEWEYIWSPCWLWTRTVIKRLTGRNRVGDPAFFEYLTYISQENTHDI